LIALLTLMLMTSTVHGAGDGQSGESTRTRPSRSAQSTADPDGRMQKRSENVAAPAAALLEYLGEFDDAADGLDAMGLADDDASTKADALQKKKERQ